MSIRYFEATAGPCRLDINSALEIDSKIQLYSFLFEEQFNICMERIV